MKLEQIFADVLRVDASALNDESSPATVKKWDSLRHMKIVVALEKAFSITLTPGEVRGMQSIGRARAMLAEKGKAV